MSVRSNDVHVVNLDSPAAAADDLQPKERNDDDDDDQVQLLDASQVVLLVRSDSQDRREQRRKRRRKLKRIVAAAKGFPSFFTLITANYDHSDKDDDDDEQDPDAHFRDIIDSTGTVQPDAATQSHNPDATQYEPAFKRVRIDVDAALGLKPSSAMVVKQEFVYEPAPLTTVSSTRGFQRQQPASASASKRSSPAATAVVVPADEGWYEGALSPMALTEDVEHLPPLQVWARRNLELFSATDQDAAALRAGRKQVRRGRVGVRCIHCAAAAAASQPMQTKNRPLPAADSVVPDVSVSLHSVPPPKLHTVGAVSYPANILAFQALCSQKATLHFENNCPYLPAAEREQLQRLLSQNQLLSSMAPGGRRPKKQSGGISLGLYYACWARRIGLVDCSTENGGGVRFARDLSLEPLPLETIKRQLQHENAAVAAAAAAAFSSGDTRIAANDDESERVLAQAVAEQPDDLSLCTSRDKSFVTDYMFITIRQMKICHAGPWDLGSRGKKTKSLRLGLAGFCCRHCAAATANDYMSTSSSSTSRSFASAADNLGSAISNSFATHLQKCYAVPTAIKKALMAYKRIHSRQMAQLPHGSQRKLVHELWTRLRNADRSEEEMKEILKNMPKPPPRLPPPPLLLDKSRIGSNTAQSGMADDDAAPNTRSDSFPVCEDPETMAILASAETDWNPDANDGLIRPSDRYLVSDFVFLTMRQLRGIAPSATEKNRLRSQAIGGLSCIHCHGQQQNVIPSWKSYPSAPDNYASALNTCFYNHMQNCFYVPNDLKRALANTRKIHSVQCSSLRFGSQRKYFNMLFSRLRAFKIAHDEANPMDVAGVANDEAVAQPVEIDCSQFSFLQIPAPSLAMYLCLNCRMVPVQFRAAGSVFCGTPNAHGMKNHGQHCRHDEFDLTNAANLLDKAIQVCCRGDNSAITSASFRDLVYIATGNNESLTQVMTEDVASALEQRQHSGTKTAHVRHSSRSKGLWRNCVPTKEIQFGEVEAAFDRFASEHPDISGHGIQNCPTLLDYLQLISPCLVVPLVEPAGHSTDTTSQQPPLLHGVLAESGESRSKDDPTGSHTNEETARMGENHHGQHPEINERRLPPGTEPQEQPESSTDNNSIESNATAEAGNRARDPLPGIEEREV